MLPEWEQLLSAAARLQRILPATVLVDGTASAIHVRPKLSRDADHVVANLRNRFDDVLTKLGSVAGWETAGVRKPVLVLGSLDGIETGVRQLIRQEQLETIVVETVGGPLTIPTHEEILRIKGALILRRNATRDYVDFAALADGLGARRAATAFDRFDRLYPQKSGESSLQQMLVQLTSPQPFDLEGGSLSEYKDLARCWHAWSEVETVCAQVACAIFDRVCESSARQEARDRQPCRRAGLAQGSRARRSARRPGSISVGRPCRNLWTVPEQDASATRLGELAMNGYINGLIWSEAPLPGVHCEIGSPQSSRSERNSRCCCM